MLCKAWFLPGSPAQAQAGAPFCVHASQLRELFSQQFLYLYVYLTSPATGVQGQCVQKPIPLTCERRPGRAASRGGFSAPRQRKDCDLVRERILRLKFETLFESEILRLKFETLFDSES